MCRIEESPVDEFLYYEGLKAEAEGRYDEAEKRFREQYERRGGDIYDLEAVKRLVRLLIDKGECIEACRITKEAVDRFNRNGVVLGLYAEACLGCERNLRALWAAHEAWDCRRGVDELLLLTEASRRKGLLVWRDRLLALSLDYPSSDAHIRAWNFLRNAGETEGGSEYILLQGKAAVAEGQIDDALKSFIRFFDTPGVVSPLLVRELGDLFAENDGGEEGAAFFASLLDSAKGVCIPAVRTAVVEQLVRCLFSEGRYQELGERMEAALDAGPVTGPAGRYYLASCVRTLGPVESVAVAERLLPKMDEPSSCSGILEEIISLLVRGGRWAEIQRLAGVIGITGPRIESARCFYITARAIDEGYLSGTGDRIGELFDEAIERDPGGYYGFLGASGSVDKTVSPGDFIPESDGAESPSRELEPYLLEFFERGMEEKGLSEVYSRISEIDGPAAARVSGKAAEGGLYLDALRIMLRWNGTRNRPPGAEILKSLYPRYFYGDIVAAAENHGVPPHIFLGLIREESAFQPDIVSRSGAVGLSQLMPTTADYVAGLMVLEDFEITDPGDNTSIGSWYLARLRDDLPSYGHSLAAYNAGPGRVAGWMRLYGGLPADLFAEAIPFLETRRYVKRVLVSSVYYGYLYGALSPEESVRLYYF